MHHTTDGLSIPCPEMSKVQSVYVCSDEILKDVHAISNISFFSPATFSTCAEGGANVDELKRLCADIAETAAKKALMLNQAFPRRTQKEETNA